MREAQWANNGLHIYTNVIRYRANLNDGHPSFDHGLKCNTYSIDPHWLALRIGFHLNPLARQSSMGSTL